METLIFRPLPDQRGLEVTWNLTVDWAPQDSHYCRRHAGGSSDNEEDGDSEGNEEDNHNDE